MNVKSVFRAPRGVDTRENIIFGFQRDGRRTHIRHRASAPRLGTRSGPRYFHGDFSHALFTTGTHLGNATGGAAVKTIGATPRTVSTRRRWRAPAAGSRVPFNINCVWNIIALEKRVPRDGPGRPVIPDACDRVRPCLCITRGGGWGGGRPINGAADQGRPNFFRPLIRRGHFFPVSRIDSDTKNVLSIRRPECSCVNVYLLLWAYSNRTPRVPTPMP